MKLPKRSMKGAYDNQGSLKSKEVRAGEILNYANKSKNRELERELQPASRGKWCNVRTRYGRRAGQAE